MEQNPIGVGILGCGAIAQRRHGPEYAADPRCKLIGCTDFLPQRAEFLAKSFGCRAFESAKALLACEEIAAVSICTRNLDHLPMALAALEAGKHVLIEKPMALTAADAEAMIAAAKKAGKMLIPGHNQRFFPGHIAARTLLASGELGEPVSFESIFAHPGPESWSLDKKGAWFFDPAQAGLGVISDLAVHKADAIRWVMGREITSLSCQTSHLCRSIPGLHEHAEILCKLEGGVTGFIRASWCNFGTEANKTNIYCKGGVLRINPRPGCDLEIDRGGRLESVDLGGIPTNRNQIASGVISGFLDAILGAEPFADWRDGLASARFTDACSAALKTGSFIKL